MPDAPEIHSRLNHVPFVLFFFSPRINKGQGVDIKSLSSRSVLTVTNMTEDRFGNYTCVATNKLGMANASASLISEFLGISARWERCTVTVPSRQLWKAPPTFKCFFFFLLFYLLQTFLMHHQVKECQFLAHRCLHLKFDLRTGQNSPWI